MKKRVMLLALVLSIVMLVTSCTGATTASSQSSQATSASSVKASTSVGKIAPFRISAILPLSGTSAVTGVGGKRGVDLAIKYINANGGINGAQIEIKYYDTTNNSEESAKIAQKIIASEEADAVINSVNSNEVAANINFLNKAKLYNFGLGTSAAWMQNPENIWTFRACNNNSRNVPQAVEAIKLLGLKSIAIMNSTSDAEMSTANDFEKYAKAQGIIITTRQQADNEDGDYSGQINQILASKPDGIYMAMWNITNGPFVKQVRNMGYTGMIGSKEPFGLDAVGVAGPEASNYVFFAYPYVVYNSIEDCDIPIMKNFLESFKKEYNEMPQTEHPYRGWDTMMALWEASKIAGSNKGDALREATNKVKIEGLGGLMDFTKGDREAYSAFNMFVFENGKNILLKDWLTNGGHKAYLTKTGRDK